MISGIANFNEKNAKMLNLDIMDKQQQVMPSIKNMDD